MIRRALTVLAGVALLTVAALTLPGCEKALFPEGSARSPYTRYDALRGRERPATEENAYGGSQPALRERLRPMGEP